MTAPLLNKASFASYLTVPALRVGVLQCQAALAHLKHLLIKVPKIKPVVTLDDGARLLLLQCAATSAHPSVAAAVAAAGGGCSGIEQHTIKVPAFTTNPALLR
jgi:hypothetical protein